MKFNISEISLPPSSFGSKETINTRGKLQTRQIRAIVTFRSIKIYRFDKIETKQFFTRLFFW